METYHIINENYKDYQNRQFNSIFVKYILNFISSFFYIFLLYKIFNFGFELFVFLLLCLGMLFFFSNYIKNKNRIYIDLFKFLPLLFLGLWIFIGAIFVKDGIIAFIGLLLLILGIIKINQYTPFIKYIKIKIHNINNK